jgi:peptidoglycan/LPS O-acetylase OafA/YrhL
MQLHFSAPGKPRLPSLDAWRGMCALLVALFHLNVLSHFYTLSLIRGASLCVDFFFVLSGFIMRYVYQESVSSKVGSVSFLIRRFGRLWPLHMATLFAIFVLEYAKYLSVNVFHYGTGSHIVDFGGSAVKTWLSLLSQIFLLQNIGLFSTFGGGLEWNFPSWSISVEFYTYWVFLSVCFVNPVRRNFVALALSMLGAVILVVFNRANILQGGDFAFFRCLYDFFIGFIFFDIYLKVNRLWGPTLQEFIATGMFVAFVSLVNAPLNMLAPFVFGYIVIVFAFADGAISRFLKTLHPTMLGTWSYSIYMVHNGVIIALGNLLHILQFQTHRSFFSTVYDDLLRQNLVVIQLPSLWLGDVLVLLYIGAVLLVASQTYRFVEVPGRRYFNRLAKCQISDGKEAAGTRIRII